MSKKPASLTSDLLARKGEAEPSTIDPSARMTLSAGSGFSDDEGGGGQERQEPNMGRDTEIRPIPPEPEIIYTAEETGSGGSKTRLIIAIVLGIIIVGGIFLAMSGGEKGEVAPVSPNLTSEAPTTTEQPTAPAPAASAPEEEISPAEQLRAAAMGNGENAGETTSPEPAAPAPAETAATPEAAPAAPAAETPAPVAAAPEPAAPAAPVEAAKPAAPAPATTPQAGGAYVVQLLALRDEAAAKTAWKKIVAKHKGILASHALDIEKADLGSKGVWYRVRAAGFSDKAAATRACNNLKAAGQDCIVKKR